MTFHERLRNLREDTEPKLTQSDVAGKCGMTQRKLSFIENGTTEPSIEDIRALCSFYHVSADYLLGLPEGLPYLKR